MVLQDAQIFHNKKYSFILLIILLLILGGTIEQAHSNSDQRVSQSLGKQISVNTKISKEMLDSVEPQFNPPFILNGTRNDVVNTTQFLQRSYIGNSLSATAALNSNQSHSFTINNVSINLISDDDYDSYYHNFTISFDANVSSGSALVYARLYFSYEGGPWNHYYTTQTFTIIGNDRNDTYQVATDLATGYPSGSYDILIKLYEQDWSGMVASYGPLDDTDLYNLLLEDADHDIAYENSNSAAGCSIMSSAKFDPVFIFLILIALLHLSKTTWNKYKL